VQESVNWQDGFVMRKGQIYSTSSNLQESLNWQDEFVKNCTMQESTNYQDFKPPFYNQRQQAAGGDTRNKASLTAVVEPVPQPKERTKTWD
jgi:hypothetical protein